jgi:large repetitive protein
VDRAGNISGSTTFTCGAAFAALTSPAAGAKSTDLFTVKGSAPPAGSGTTVTPTIYWRAAGAAEPADFSATNGSKTGWTAFKTLSAVQGGNTVSGNEKCRPRPQPSPWEGQRPGPATDAAHSDGQER